MSTDESKIAAFIAKGLKTKDHIITIAEDADSAINLVLDSEFDLTLSKLGLPQRDCLSILEEWRGQRIRFPVIILTAKDDVLDKEPVHRVVQTTIRSRTLTLLNLSLVSKRCSGVTLITLIPMSECKFAVEK